nr:hypothetical protein [Tanacetum cinerariifolium]
RRRRGGVGKDRIKDDEEEEEEIELFIFIFIIAVAGGGGGMVAWRTISRDFWNGGAAMSTSYGPLVRGRTWSFKCAGSSGSFGRYPLKGCGSITTREDLTTRFLAQFFPPGRTTKLRNDIMIFQKNHGESLSKAWTRFKDLLQKVPHHGIDLWLKVQIFYDHVNPVTRRTIDQSAGVVPATLSIEWKIPRNPLLNTHPRVPMKREYAKLTKFEADFKQQQSKMTYKIVTVLKAIINRIAGAPPRDTVKNLKLSTSPVLFARFYPTIDPQFSSHPSTSINAIKAHSKEATISQTSLLRPEIEIEMQQPKEPEPTPKDEFQDLHLNLPVLEVLAHAPIYNAILDKYVEILELGKNGSTFIQGEVPAKIEDPRLFTLLCRLGDLKPFDTLADLGSCVNIIPLYPFKKLNIRLLEETDHICGLADGTKSNPVGIVKDVKVHIGKLKLLNDFYVINMKKDPETPLLVGRGFLATASAIIDCKMAKIVVGEGITRSVFRVKIVDLGEEEAPYWTTLRKRESYKPRLRSDEVGAQTPSYARKDFLDCHLPREWEIARDAELNPFKDVLVFRMMTERNLPKPYSQSPPLESSLKEKVQGKSSTWTTSMTLDVTWMAFEGNTRDLDSFGEETYEITDLHQILEEVLLTKHGDGVACIKRRRRDPSSDGIRDLVTTSGRSRLNEDLESST